MTFYDNRHRQNKQTAAIDCRMHRSRHRSFHLRLRFSQNGTYLFSYPDFPASPIRMFAIFCCNTLNFVIRKLRRYVCVIFVSKCSSIVSFFIARQYAKACRARCFRGQIRSSVRHTLTLVLFLIFQGRAVDEVGSFERTFLNINQSINQSVY